MYLIHFACLITWVKEDSYNNLTIEIVEVEGRHIFCVVNTVFLKNGNIYYVILEFIGDVMYAGNKLINFIWVALANESNLN